MTSTDLPEQDAPRYVRLSIEIIAEITDEQALKAAALAQVQSDEYLDDEERTQSVEAIEVDPSGSLAHFIDPVALLGEVPGIELTSATWESAQTEFDPTDENWDEYSVEPVVRPLAPPNRPSGLLRAGDSSVMAASSVVSYDLNRLVTEPVRPGLRCLYP
ncbi:hypothetical protein ACFQ0T_16290 [Kitasatospora gansuensis]